MYAAAILATAPTQNDTVPTKVVNGSVVPSIASPRRAAPLARGEGVGTEVLMLWRLGVSSRRL